jgi:hypothetical protein
LVSEVCRRLGSLLIGLCAFGLVGCAAASTDASESGAGPGGNNARAAAGQGKALEAYVEAGQDNVPDLIKAFDGVYSDIGIKAKSPGTVQYRYVFSQQANPQRATRSLKRQAPTLKSSCETAIFPDMAKAGITNEARVRFIYLNADRSMLWSYTCRSS